MTAKKIVIIEDEPAIADVLSYNLKREGFDVAIALDGNTGLELVRHVKPDLILLDLMLPGIDGLEICSQIKRDGLLLNTLVIMLTAKDEESDVVLGLGVGADDYISKPFSPRELVARVKAALRRKYLIESGITKDKIECGGLTIDTLKYQVLVKGEEVKLTKTEFKILHYLASNIGRVFSREKIINSAIGDSSEVIDRNIDVHVRGIRKKLSIEPSVIETIRGIGYKFESRL